MYDQIGKTAGGSTNYQEALEEALKVASNHHRDYDKIVIYFSSAGSSNFLPKEAVKSWDDNSKDLINKVEF